MSAIGKRGLCISIMFLLLLSPALSYFGTQEVDNLREHTFLLLNFANSSIYPNQKRFFLVHNPDKRQMFLTMQLIPLPLYQDCYTHFEQCNQTIWDTSFEVNYVGADGIVNKVIGDTSSCWDWWNTSNPIDVGQTEFLFQREENKTLCPIVSIPFNPEDDSFNITFNMTSSESGKALPYLNVRVFEYSTAYTNTQQKFSATADASLTNLSTLILINKNIWKLAYYTLVIALVIIGGLMVVGGIPLGIKWIISKLGG